MIRAYTQFLISALLAAGMLMPACSHGASQAPSAQAPHNCSDVNLTGWHHPTRTVLEAAGIGLARVQRCDDGKLDIFTVTLKYDPRTATSHYYSKLYARMAEANGWNAYMLDDKTDQVRVKVSVGKASHKLSVDYEKLD